VKLYSALEKSFVRVPRRVVVGGVYVWVCSGTCVWGGVYLCQDLRAVFCKTDVISEFTVSAKDCGEIFFRRSWACNFWMQGVICDNFLATSSNALVNAFLVSLSLRRLE